MRLVSFRRSPVFLFVRLFAFFLPLPLAYFVVDVLFYVVVGWVFFRFVL